MILSEPERIERYTRSGIWGQNTLDALLHRTAQEAPERTALVDPPNKQQIMDQLPLRLSYARADGIVENLADTFRTLGLAPDDVVAVQLPNTIEAVLTILACLRAGLIVCPLPVIWREHELAKALPNIAPRALITAGRIFDHEHADMMRNIAAELMTVRFVLGFGSDLPDGVMSLDASISNAGPEANSTSSKDEIDANSIATLTWSAGNSEREYTIPRSHNQWISAGLMLMLESKLQPDSNILNPYPLTSLLPLGLMSAWLLSGGTLHQHHPFSQQDFLKQLQDENITFTCLPPTASELFNDREKALIRSTLTSLGCILHRPVIDSINASPLAGMSDIIIDINVLEEFVCLADRRLGGKLKLSLPYGEINKPSDSLDQITLAETMLSGSVLKSHFSAGKLSIRSPMMFDCHYPPTISDAMDRQLHINTKGFVDTTFKAMLVQDEDKEIELLQKPSETFQHGGVPVATDELDNLYAACEQLSDAAALPIDDPVMGKRILAAIVPNPGISVSFEEFKQYLAARKVAPYKIPDRMITVKSIPRGRRGEVLRDKILDQA